MDHYESHTRTYALRMLLARATADIDSFDRTVAEISENGGCLTCVINQALDICIDALDRCEPDGALAAITDELTGLLDREEVT